MCNKILGWWYLVAKFLGAQKNPKSSMEVQLVYTFNPMNYNASFLYGFSLLDS